MKKLFTSESVTEGHPDKLCDQISDGILDAVLAQDSMARCAIECCAAYNQLMIMGEITTTAKVKYKKVARDIMAKVGYTFGNFRADNCKITLAVHRQSPDIAMGVDSSLENRTGGELADLIGAGDQGMMFGYACNETDNYMPLTLDLSHLLLRELAAIRREGNEMPYLRPDAKSQVTVEYNEERKPVRVHTIVVSTQHDEFVQPADNSPEAQDAADRAMHDRILADVRSVLLPRVMAKLPERVRALFDDQLILLVNPTGKFVIGGPHGDTGLTGRKIIVDTYGGRGAHGGGAFSGKDPSKVDRSAAYAVRHIAKNAVAAGIADEMLVQVAYAIGCAEPVSLYVSTFGTKHVPMTDAEIADRFARIFDLRPSSIVRDLKLLNPIYEETAAYGHVGREPQVVEKHFHSKYEGEKTLQVELFTWEKLDYVGRLKAEFGLA